MNETHKQSDALLSVAAVTALGVLSAAMFTRELFFAGDTVRSHHFGDLRLYFISIRRFGFAELANGNLPLWNPHLFSGTPFVGSFQSAMLYPINLLYLVFPLVKAIHVDLALHVFLIGTFMFGWMRSKGVSVPAAFLAGTVLMFGQVTSSRVLAGQLTLVAAFAWAPLLFWAADKIIERPSMRWTLVGIAAASMQLLAGYPQFAFMTAVTLGLYCAMYIRTANARLRTIGALAAIAVAPLFISAAQLWIGMYTLSESIRSERLPFEFASSFSFPPESLLTVLAPGIFGNFVEIPYWGRWIFWDANAYIGATALVCGVIGAIYAPARVRIAVGVVALAIFVLCMGKYTPIYKVFYMWIPGFDRIRAPSKFLFLVTMLWCVFVAFGMDRLIRRPRVARGIWIAPAILGCLLMIAANAVWDVGGTRDGFFVTIYDKIKASPDCFMYLFSEPNLSKAASYAAWNLCAAGVACLLVAAGVANARRSIFVPLALIVFGIVEVFGAGRTFSSTIQLRDLERTELVEFYAAHAGDHRVLDTLGQNHALDAGVYAAWGYDPVILRRYAEFMRLTQGSSFGGVLQSPTRYHPLMDMIRCRFITGARGVLPAEVYEVGDPLPRALLIRDVVVHETREEIGEALMSTNFNPRKTVILEEPLNLDLDKDDTRGQVEILDTETDYLTLSIDTPSPAVLLITDSYSPGWRAVSLVGSAEDSYRVLPANYTIRAIPLTAGRHRVRLEYAPWPFRVGKWVSIVSVALFAAACAWTFSQRSTRR